MENDEYEITYVNTLEEQIMKYVVSKDDENKLLKDFVSYNKKLK